MPLDHYVTMGNSGLRVSPFCLGGMTFGEDWGWGSSVADSEKIIDRYIADGGNFIDTANAYTKGHSEKIIGDHIGRTRKRRDRLVIATKFMSNLFPGDPNGGGAGRKAIIAQCEESLRRLQTDYIDLYWMHILDLHTPIEETLRALDTLVESGKVRYIGVSDTPAWKVTEAQLLTRFHGWAPLVALQIEYSLLQRTVEGELMPMAKAMGLGVTPWSPLKSGVLSGKYSRQNHGKEQPDRGAYAASALNDRAYDVIEGLEAVAKEQDSTVARVALAWVQNRPGVTSTIVGARTLKQLEDNLAAVDVKLTPAQVQRLDELSKPTLPFPIDFVNGGLAFYHGGTTINGQSAPRWPASPKDDDDRY